MDRLVDIARQHGISTQTLRDWEEKGLVKFDRTTLGRRLVTKEAIERIEEIIKDRTEKYLPKEENNG